MMKPIKTLLPIFLLCALLSACSSDDDDRILPGERLSVLQLQAALTPSPQLQGQPLVLPEPWTNQFWPQVGGYPNHAMGNLQLGQPLKKAWSRSIGDGGDRRHPLTSAPVAAEGLVFTLDVDGDVAAFDLKDGTKKWETTIVPRGVEDSGAIGGGLAYASGRLYVTSGYPYLTALNPQSGKQLWKTKLPAPARSAPTVMNEQVYVITLDSRLMVFGAADGAPLWNYAGVSETTNLLGSASPAVDESLVVLPLSSGELFGLRPENGTIVWEDNLSAVRRTGSLSTIADIRGLPVVDQGVVYALSYSGRMVALDEVTGRRLWQREIGSAEMPWAAGEVLFVISTDQQLVAMTRQGGDIYWVQALPRFADEKHDEPIVYTGPVLAGGRLFTASSQGDLYEIDPQTGKILQKTSTGGGVTIPLLVADNTLLALNQKGELIAWR